jgi:hypothetical protein
MTALEHTRSCGVFSTDADHCMGDCTCGLEWRKRLAERQSELDNVENQFKSFVKNAHECLDQAGVPDFAGDYRLQRRLSWMINELGDRARKIRELEGTL